MSDSKKKNKLRKSYEMNKDEVAKFNITLNKTALQNYEKIKDKLAYKSLSSAITQLLQFAVDNIELLKTVKLPGGEISDKIANNMNQFSLLLAKLPKETEQQESRFVKLESTQEEILNKLDKLLNIAKEENPKLFEKVKSEINGLGGKL